MRSFEAPVWELSCLAVDTVSYTIDLFEAKEKLLVWWLGEDTIHCATCSRALQLMFISVSDIRFACYNLYNMPSGLRMMIPACGLVAFGLVGSC